MPLPKIDLAELNRMLREGKTQQACAEHFSVTKGAVSMARKRLKNTVTKITSLEKASELIEADLNLMTRFKSNMETILEELEEVKKELKNSDGGKGQLRESLISLISENRKHLSLLKDIAESWYYHQEAAEFREEVLNVLEEEAPGTKEKVLNRLRQARALRSAVRIA